MNVPVSDDQLFKTPDLTPLKNLQKMPKMEEAMSGMDISLSEKRESPSPDETFGSQAFRVMKLMNIKK